MFKNYRLIYLITVLSGAAGLVYEITWTRMLVYIFGSSAYSTVAVISAFLGGIAIGSYFIGRWIDNKNPVNLKKVYYLLEFGIALSVAITVFVLPNLHVIYRIYSDGTNFTPEKLIAKFLLSSIVLLVPTILMGGTIPVLVAILKNKLAGLDNSISILYSLNTLGAVLGVLASAFITIELFGIKESILFGAILNILAGILISFVNVKSVDSQVEISTKKLSFSARERIVLVCFFATGFIAIAYEIIWSRVLAPSVGTYIYAFAIVLSIYLFGTFLGALIYNKLLQRKNVAVWLFSISQAGIAVFATASVIAVIQINFQVQLTLACIFAASFFMGISFPAGSFLLKNKLHEGRVAGIIYLINTSGCILGGIIAVFVFFPVLGSVPSILVLSIFSTILAIILLFLIAVKSKKYFKPYIIILVILIFIPLYLLIFRRADLYEARTAMMLAYLSQNGAEWTYREDNLATVVGAKSPGNADVFVNGVGMTGMVIETRLMAHLPIAMHPNPKKFLAICLGIGSTYRSARLHGLDVDVVELSPSVASMLPMFYDDLDRLPGKGRVIVNDGRNYVNLSRKKYDIIVVDPPPPLNSAGTTVLYSEEFYKSMIKILEPAGIVMEWMIPGDRPEDILMTKKSFLNVFPYVTAIRWGSGSTPGYFMFGSRSAIKFDEDKINNALSSALVRDDIIQFRQVINYQKLSRMIVTKEELIKETKNIKSVTDDHPRTEYFILRYLFPNLEK